MYLMGFWKEFIDGFREGARETKGKNAPRKAISPPPVRDILTERGRTRNQLATSLPVATSLPDPALPPDLSQEPHSTLADLNRTSGELSRKLADMAMDTSRTDFLRHMFDEQLETSRRDSAYFKRMQARTTDDLAATTEEFVSSPETQIPPRELAVLAGIFREAGYHVGKYVPPSTRCWGFFQVSHTHLDADLSSNPMASDLALECYAHGRWASSVDREPLRIRSDGRDPFGDRRFLALLHEVGYQLHQTGRMGEWDIQVVPTGSTADVVAKRLSYADAAQHASIRIQRLIKENLARVKMGDLKENEVHYGNALIDLQEQAVDLDSQVLALHARLLPELAKIGLREMDLTSFSRSLTWVYWDFAKQYYLAKHPHESSPEYHLGSPMEDTQVREDILNRHLGWELYEKWRGDYHQEIADALDRLDLELRADLLGYLNRTPKSNHTLSSSALAELGALYRRAFP